MIPGEVILNDGAIEVNRDRATVKLAVTNTSERPVQIGSHAHFQDVNMALSFNRDAVHGKRLNIVSGTTLRLKPGETREVELVEYHVAGFDDIRKFGRIEIAERNLSILLDGDQANEAALFYVFFTAMDLYGDFIKLNDSEIKKVIIDGRLSIVNYLSHEKYKVGCSDDDLGGNDFVLKGFATRNYVNVLEFISTANFTGLATLAVLFAISDGEVIDGQKISTAFMSISDFDSGAVVFQ